jgi:hypothetical protein
LSIVASEDRRARLVRLGLGPVVRPVVFPLEEEKPEPVVTERPMAPYDEYREPRKINAAKWTTSVKAPLWRQILVAVANDHNIDPLTILTRGRSRPRLLARQDLFWRLSTQTSMTAGEIALRVEFDESTVRHAIRCHQRRLDGGQK